MEWKEDRKYVLEALKDQKDAHDKINDSIQRLSTRVIGKVHEIDKRTEKLDSRIKVIAGGLVMAIGALIKKFVG